MGVSCCIFEPCSHVGNAVGDIARYLIPSVIHSYSFFSKNFYISDSTLSLDTAPCWIAKISNDGIMLCFDLVCEVLGFDVFFPHFIYEVYFILTLPGVNLKKSCCCCSVSKVDTHIGRQIWVILEFLDVYGAIKRKNPP